MLKQFRFRLGFHNFRQANIAVRHVHRRDSNQAVIDIVKFVEKAIVDTNPIAIVRTNE